MNQELYLHESILLLSLDDEKGNFTTSLSYLNYGFISALMMDLIIEERINIKDNHISLKTNALTENQLLNKVLRIFQETEKTKTASDWIHTLVRDKEHYMSGAIDNLINKKILDKREEKFMWVFNTMRYPAVDMQPENLLRARLRKIIFNDEKPKEKEGMLLAIIQACHMEKDLILDKEKLKMARERIKSLTKNNEMQSLVSGAIEEMLAIITVITTI
jgi:hypothetical protein